MEFEKCAIMSGFRRSGHIYLSTLMLEPPKILRQKCFVGEITAEIFRLPHDRHQKCGTIIAGTSKGLPLKFSWAECYLGWLYSTAKHSSGWRSGCLLPREVTLIDKNRVINVRAALPPIKRRTRSSSHYSGATRPPLYPCCKFEINLRLFAIWLIVKKYIIAIKSRNSTFGLLCHMRRKKLTIPHSMVMQSDACMICTRSLNSI